MKTLLLAAWACFGLLPASAQHGIPARPDVDAFYDGVFPPTPPAIASEWSAVVAFPNLTFLNPVGLTAVPGTNLLLVWEREGRIYAFENDPAISEKTLVVDLSANTQGWDDSGMLGVALHPDFQNNRQMWVWYNWRGGQAGGSGDLGPVIGSTTTRPPTSTPTRNRLSRFVLDANFQTAQAEEYVVIDQKDASVWHNGGGMFFHPENGFLYITNGDDQNAALNTQRIDRGLFSCVIRIDVDRRGGDISHPPVKRPLNEVSPEWPRYHVPNDNPFVGQPDALEEIFAIGLRSPHRMTCDPVTGRIFIGDVGAGSREEISVIEPNDPPGLNFQWSRIEGKNGNLAAPFIGTDKPPIIDYSHAAGEGSCVVGGYVYRGTAFPELYGKYIFGDNMSGIVWYLDENVNPAVKRQLAILPDGPGPNSGNDYRGLGSFGVDATGELYLCRLSSTEGRIYKLRRGGPDPGTPLPATLGATGLFSDLAALTPDTRLIPYELNAPFWSDGAIKSRFAAIPNAAAVGFQPTGDWNFPTGSVLVKHFDLPASDVNPAAKRRIETRVIVKQPDGEVYGATYKWRADGSDADLLDGGLTESIPIATEPIGTLTGQDIGSPALAGSTVRNGNAITVTAGGTDIWGASDQFHFAHQSRTGDFDVAVRIESVVQSDLYTKTGLMVRDSLAANARHIMALVFPSNAARNNNTGGYEFQYRATAGGNATALYPATPQPRVNYPETWIRMRREGDTFIAYWSSDGFTWAEYSRTTLDLPDTLFFGLAVTAHTASPVTVAKFHVDTRRQPWYYPSRQDCARCHNPQAGGVLGLSTRQLNREVTYPNGVTENQLAAWMHVNLFDTPPAPDDLAALEKLNHHEDGTASLQQRARSYLDSNCAYCHRPGGAQALWDGRYLTPFPDQGIYYGSLSDNLGNPDARVVVPRNVGNSILHHRISITGEHQMPPVARNLVDSAGVDMLAAWIDSLPEETVIPSAYLAAIARSHTEVDLTWEDLSDNEAGFSIERSYDGSTFVGVGIGAPGETTFTDAGAEPFRTVRYRVKAFGNYVYSSPSNVATAVTDVGPPAAEIHVTGNDLEIPSGDPTPDPADGTYFGVRSPGSGSVSREFRIANLGNLDLKLGVPPVRIEGSDASSFTLAAQPSEMVGSGSSLVFTVVFSPTDFGTKVATVVIDSNDPSEPVTSFAITGVGVDDGLVAWWSFDEGAGTIAYDLSGAGHDGTFTEPLPQWVASGRRGGALRFTGELNQSVTVANHPALNPTDEITIATWASADDWASNRRFLQKGDGDNQYRLLAENGDLVWEIDNVGRIEATLPPAGEWFHVAGTYDGSRMRLFVNGTPVGAASATGEIPAVDQPLFIGTKTAASIAGDHLNGMLDDTRIYSRALTGGEVAELAETTPADGIVAWWKLDESSGILVSDATGSEHDGTLTAPLPTWQPAGGRLGGALRFTEVTGQSVTVANASALNPTDSLSVTAWANATGWTGNQRILQKGNTDNQYRLLAEAGRFAWHLAGVGRIEADLPPAGRWVHVAGTYDGNRMALYFDGAEVAAADASAALQTTNNPLHLGTKTAGSGVVNHLDGLLDDVRLYGRGLTAAEVASLAAHGSMLNLVATDPSARKGTSDAGRFTITREGPTVMPLLVPLNLEASEALQGIDFTFNPGLNNVVIPAGQANAVLDVLPILSGRVSGTRVVTVGLGLLPEGMVAGAGPASVTVFDTAYHDWKIATFGGLQPASSAEATDDADADGDGLSTMLEAALGGDPLVSDPERRPTEEVELVDGLPYLMVTYRRPRPPIEGLSYSHRWSLSLDEWDAAVPMEGYPLDHGDGTETVKFRTPLPLGESPRQFLRLEVE